MLVCRVGTDMKMEIMKKKIKAPKIKDGAVGLLDGKVIVIHGFIENENGLKNIHYVGQGIEGVCMKSFWTKYVGEPKEERGYRQAGSGTVS